MARVGPRHGHPLLPPAQPRLNPRHPLANGLTRLWLVPPGGAGGDRLVNYAPSQPGLEAQFGANSQPKPSWDTTMLGPAVNFDGVDDCILVTTTSQGLYKPETDGIPVTVALVARADVYAATTTVLYSQNKPDDVDRSLEVNIRSGRLRVIYAANNMESTGADLTTVPPAGNPFAYVGAIIDATNSKARWRDLTTGQTVTGTDATGNVTTTFAGTMAQESFGAWAGGYPSVGGISQPTDSTIWSVAVWNRTLSDAEMDVFLADPYGMLREPVTPQWVAPGINATAAGALFEVTHNINLSGTATADSAAGGLSLVTNWTLFGAQAEASSAAPGSTLTETWSVIPQAQTGGFTLVETWTLTGGTATGTATAAGATLVQSWFLTPGAAGAAGTASGATLTETWSLTSGGAGGSRTAAGQTVSTAWSLLPGGAASSTPSTPRAVPIIGGGGMGPGGDPATAARIRASAERAAERAFDPVGWSQKQSEEAARKMREALQAETERTRPERLKRSTLRFLSLTEDE